MHQQASGTTPQAGQRSPGVGGTHQQGPAVGGGGGADDARAPRDAVRYMRSLELSYKVLAARVEAASRARAGKVCTICMCAHTHMWHSSKGKSNTHATHAAAAAAWLTLPCVCVRCVFRF